MTSYRIGIPIGDPAGIGPEVLLSALAQKELRQQFTPVVFGSASVLQKLSRQLSYPIDFLVVEPDRALSWCDVRPGEYSKACAQMQVACLQAAADALEKGEVEALVTGPIHKRALVECNQPGPGHTEWLADRFGCRQPVMMLAGPRLRVVLATTHVALRDVAKQLDQQHIVDVIRISKSELEHYFVDRTPRLALAALNPHGEENGLVGLEEKKFLLPAIAQLAKLGIEVAGPVAGDTVFAQAAFGQYDAVIATYHDQGLAAVKTLHFHDAVNVTLGLGRVRTSPDHGPAYDIAWQGQASSQSMQAALRTAVMMVETPGQELKGSRTNERS